MSKKDEALKLALEALEAERDNYQDWDEKDGAPEYIHEAITALRETLAEQPAPMIRGDIRDGLVDDEPAQQQEPVAYIRKDQLQKAAQSPMLCEVTPEPRQDRIGIYTSPPAQRKPLTDEEILSVARDHYNPHQRPEISFARAIEAAHGIKGDA